MKRSRKIAVVRLYTVNLPVHNVMLLALKEDTTTVASTCVIYFMCLSWLLNLSRWHVGKCEPMYTIGYCPCNRLLAICALTVVHTYIWILQSYREVLCLSLCLKLLLHLLLIILQVVALVQLYGVYQMMNCLLLHGNVINLLVCLFVWLWFYCWH